MISSRICWNGDTETSPKHLISQSILPQHNVAHCCFTVIRWQPMGSKIAFWNCFVSFALGLPACNQNTFSLRYLDYKRKPEHFWYQHLAPLPTNSNLIWLKHSLKQYEDRLINSGVDCFWSIALSVFLYVTTRWRQMKTIIKSSIHFIEVLKMRHFLFKVGQNCDFLFSSPFDLFSVSRKAI